MHTSVIYCKQKIIKIYMKVSSTFSKYSFRQCLFSKTRKKIDKKLKIWGILYIINICCWNLKTRKKNWWCIKFGYYIYFFFAVPRITSWLFECCWWTYPKRAMYVTVWFMYGCPSSWMRQRCELLISIKKWKGIFNDASTNNIFILKTNEYIFDAQNIRKKLYAYNFLLDENVASFLPKLLLFHFVTISAF